MRQVQSHVAPPTFPRTGLHLSGLLALALVAACASSESGGGGAGGAGGAGTGSTSSAGGGSSTTSATGTTSSSDATSTTSGTTSSSDATSTTSGTTSSTSTGGGPCEDPTNPMFGSCVEAFLAGCWAPDLSGTCMDDGSTVSWSDGSKYTTAQPKPGIYGPGDVDPCIAITIANGVITATKGGQTLTFTGSPNGPTIGCPDGSSFQATNAQVTTFNQCTGLNCPP